MALKELLRWHQQTKPPGLDDENRGKNLFVGDAMSSTLLMKVLYNHHRLQLSILYEIAFIGKKQYLSVFSLAIVLYISHKHRSLWVNNHIQQTFCYQMVGPGKKTLYLEFQPAFLLPTYD